ncbi:hypothetical protein [Streptomyces lydicus]|uniref:hypothetical protein n=1 Tax=Streptomyces lydicus TaxID=47763 RepID=UPI0037982CD7
MAFKTDRLVAAISEIPRHILNELPSKLENAVSGIRVVVESTLTAAQNARDSAAATHARVDAVHTELQALHRDLHERPTTDRDHTRLLAEFASLRAAVEGWRAEAAALRADTQPAHEPPPPVEQPPIQPAEPDDTDFEQLLTQAAGTAYAEITCHRDHWDFLVAQSSSGQHFRLPGAVDEQGDGLITADVSGRTLIAVLDALWKTRQNTVVDPGTRHLAASIYQRIGQALNAVASHTPTANGSTRPDVTHIVIDDRPPARNT